MEEPMEKIKKVILKRLAKLKKAYIDYQNNPYDPETAHAIRTNSRKLRSVLNFLKKTFDAEEYQRLNSELKALAMIYGPVREADILAQWCAEIARDKPDMSGHYREMFNYLGKERRKEMRRTFNKTNVRAAESAMDIVDSGVENLSLDEKSDWGRYIKKRLVKKNRRLMNDYDTVDMDDYTAVHEIRKKAKKMRFSAKYLGKLTSVKHKKMAGEAQNIQDDFGLVTDARVNRRMLMEYAEKADDEALEKLFRKMAKEQEKLLHKKNKRRDA